MTTTPNDDHDPEICLTCNNSREWHRQFKPAHPFNDGTSPSTAWLGQRDRKDKNEPQRGAERPAWPFDPVLRQALIDKGVLTPEDLRTAEEKIRAVSAVFMEGMNNG